jgi:hypothetical protein
MATCGFDARREPPLPLLLMMTVGLAAGLAPVLLLGLVMGRPRQALDLLDRARRDLWSDVLATPFLVSKRARARLAGRLLRRSPRLAGLVYRYLNLGWVGLGAALLGGLLGLVAAL